MSELMSELHAVLVWNQTLALMWLLQLVPLASTTVHTTVDMSVDMLVTPSVSRRRLCHGCAGEGARGCRRQRR
jgi:hypothetical protein